MKKIKWKIIGNKLNWKTYVHDIELKLIKLSMQRFIKLEIS